MEFYVLPRHAAQCLGVDPSALDLPRSEYGIDADALWVCPRFIEIRRQREVTARKMAERRFDIQPHMQHKSRPEEEREAALHRTRQRRYARKKLQRKAQSKRAAVTANATIGARLSVAAYAIAHGMIPHNLRQKLRAAGYRAPYSLADVERVTPLALPSSSVI
jgi:hypothetical protein